MRPWHYHPGMGHEPRAPKRPLEYGPPGAGAARARKLVAHLVALCDAVLLAVFVVTRDFQVREVGGREGLWMGISTAALVGFVAVWFANVALAAWASRLGRVGPFLVCWLVACGLLVAALILGACALAFPSFLVVAW